MYVENDGNCFVGLQQVLYIVRLGAPLCSKLFR